MLDYHVNELKYTKMNQTFLKRSVSRNTEVNNIAYVFVNFVLKTENIMNDDSLSGCCFCLVLICFSSTDRTLGPPVTPSVLA